MKQFNLNVCLVVTYAKDKRNNKNTPFIVFINNTSGSIVDIVIPRMLCMSCGIK